jgi:5-methylcytosine-specific restriction endonuclease McrA
MLAARNCKGCGQDKPVSEFRFRPDKRLHVTRCLRCESADQARNYRRLKSGDPIRWKVQVIRSGRSKYVTREWLEKRIREQDHRCALTGREIDILTLEVDHILPRCDGGSDELHNLQLVCRDANAAKGALSNDQLIELCRDILSTLAPELIGHAILEAERANHAL